jgi:hypothetical protein
MMTFGTFAGSRAVRPLRLKTLASLFRNYVDAVNLQCIFMAITTWIEIEVLISLVNLRTSSTHPISMAVVATFGRKTCCLRSRKFGACSGTSDQGTFNDFPWRG